MKNLTAAGPWMADYGRVFKNDDGDEAVCCGFSSGMGKTTTRLKKIDGGPTFDCDFVFSNAGWKTGCDWYAVDLWMTPDECHAVYLKK